MAARTTLRQSSITIADWAPDEMKPRRRTAELRRCYEHFSESTGFHVLVECEIPVLAAEDANVGEVDLIYARKHVFVLELKSTYPRGTVKEAWIHRTSTRRKGRSAGRREMRDQAMTTPCIRMGFLTSGLLK